VNQITQAEQQEQQALSGQFSMNKMQIKSNTRPQTGTNKNMPCSMLDKQYPPVLAKNAGSPSNGNVSSFDVVKKQTPSGAHPPLPQKSRSRQAVTGVQQPLGAQ